MFILVSEVSVRTTGLCCLGACGAHDVTTGASELALVTTQEKEKETGRSLSSSTCFQGTA